MQRVLFVVFVLLAVVACSGARATELEGAYTESSSANDADGEGDDRSRHRPRGDDADEGAGKPDAACGKKADENEGSPRGRRTTRWAP